MKEITMENWDDIVRAEKRKAPVKSITWGNEGWAIFKEYTKKETYFGVKHYHDPQVTGFTVQK